MYNPILRNSLPELPDKYRWKFAPYADYADALILEKRSFPCFWDRQDDELVYHDADSIYEKAGAIYDRNFGPQTTNPFYGESR